MNDTATRLLPPTAHWAESLNKSRCASHGPYIQGPAGQCTATDCSVDGLVRVSLGVAGLLWLVAVCGDVGLRD